MHISLYGMRCIGICECFGVCMQLFGLGYRPVVKTFLI